MQGVSGHSRRKNNSYPYGDVIKSESGEIPGPVQAMKALRDAFILFGKVEDYISQAKCALEYAKTYLEILMLHVVLPEHAGFLKGHEPAMRIEHMLRWMSVQEELNQGTGLNTVLQGLHLDEENPQKVKQLIIEKCVNGIEQSLETGLELRYFI